MGTIIKSPTPIPTDSGLRRVFLAGSIESGTAPDWQRMLALALLDIPRLLILDPRRDEWDERFAEGERFRAQVEWELDGLDAADIVAYHFAPGTKAPITLFELGLHARSHKPIVCCPEGFWRKPNIDVICQRYAIEQVDDLTALAAAIRRRLDAPELE
jgi:hypothetical protein